MKGKPSEKVALVTGAGSGIGRAVAIALMREGWSTVLAGRRADALEETAALGRGLSSALVAPTDVTDPLAVDALYDAVRRQYARLDMLFNNAGVTAPGVPFEELTFEQWKKVIDTNLNGMFLCAQGAFRIMKAQSPQGGRIINNGSISAHVPRPNSAPYSASKHAVTGLTRSISLDGRRYRIACGQIDIGNARSEAAARLGQGTPQANGSIMAEPLMELDEVAGAVCHMASLPLEANIQFMTIMATNMPYIGRG